MIGEGFLLPLNVHRKGVCCTYTEPSVLYVQESQNRGAEVNFKSDKFAANIKITSDGLLILDRGRIFVGGETLVYRKVNIDMLSKLLAFVDFASDKNKNQSTNTISITYIAFEAQQLLKNKDIFEKWFIVAILHKNQWVADLCKLLRKTECYQLVRFLIESSTSTLSLNQLGKVYGLSYSHFRRLCRNALGGKVKSELCSWRMARCILEVLEGESDITTIAHKYGYSSSSHFSAEVKNKIGRSPRDLFRRLEK